MSALQSEIFQKKQNRILPTLRCQFAQAGPVLYSVSESRRMKGPEAQVKSFLAQRWDLQGTSSTRKILTLRLKQGLGKARELHFLPLWFDSIPHPDHSIVTPCKQPHPPSQSRARGNTGSHRPSHQFIYPPFSWDQSSALSLCSQQTRTALIHVSLVQSDHGFYINRNGKF